MVAPLECCCCCYGDYTVDRPGLVEKWFAAVATVVVAGTVDGLGRIGDWLDWKPPIPFRAPATFSHATDCDDVPGELVDVVPIPDCWTRPPL